MPIKRHVVAFGKQAEVLATMNVGALWDRLLGEFLGEWDRLNRQALDSAAMDRALLAFMEDLSDKDIEELARQSAGVAYNQGRTAEILSAQATGAVQFVVRSEILDQNTCSECQNLDGMVVDIASPDFKYFQPPSHCLGGDNCRGFYVAIREGAFG